MLLFILPAWAGIAPEFPPPGVFDIVKSESELRVLVYRGGLLKGFGHNHVISTNDIGGRIEIGRPPEASSMQLSIPVESFDIDIDSLRQEEGSAFEKTVSEKDRSGTRNNMLGSKLLDSARYADITMRLLEWSGDLPIVQVRIELIVKGQARILEFPATVTSSDEQISISANFVVTHAQLGLSPFKAVLGGLQVRDEMELKVRIIARRASGEIL